MKKDRVAFIGLGVMGFPMAGHLAAAGYEVSVFNRTAARSAAWAARFAGQVAESPAAAARNAAAVFCCVGDDDDVLAVMTGQQGVFEAIRPGLLLVDHTTGSADLARSLAARALEHDAWYIDAPVSGGQSGAEQGTLTIMAGGQEQAFEKVRPYLDTYAHRLRLLGGPGSGQRAKMVNQICLAGLIQGLAEGLNFARAAGLDPHAVIDVIAHGAAQSWQMDNRHATMLAGEYEHGFAVDWMRKDLGIALAEARRNGSALPVTALVDQFYARLQARGGGRWDTSSLLALLEEGLEK